MGQLIFKRGFATTPNEICNNKKLSFKAKGLWTYIQSKPIGWEFSAERIALDSTDGVTSVSTGLKELEKAGLLERVRKQDEKGFWRTGYILWDFIKKEDEGSEIPSFDFTELGFSG